LKLTGAYTAPVLQQANITSVATSEFRVITLTRSPGAAPSFTSPAASASARRANSANDSRMSSSP